MKHRLTPGSSFKIVNSGDISLFTVSNEGNVTISGTAVATQDDIDELATTHNYEGTLVLSVPNPAGFSSIDEIKNTDIIKWKTTNSIILSPSHSIASGETIVFRKQCQTENTQHIIFTALITGFYTHGANSIPFVFQLTFGDSTEGVEGYASAYQLDKGTASQISYDNDESGLSAVNVQDAIDELAMGSMPATDSVFGDFGTVSPYTKEQLIEIALKYNHNGFWLLGYNEIAKITYLNPNATYTENDLWASTFLVISAQSHLVEYDGMLQFQDLQSAIALYFYYIDEDTIMSGIAEL